MKQSPPGYTMILCSMRPGMMMNSIEHTTPTSPSLRGHIPALDGIRGAAMFLVMIHHFSRLSDTASITGQTLTCFITATWVSIDLFFVLSGFLITGILCDARERPRFFRNFYMRRFLRIFPLYYASIVLMLFLYPLLFPEHPEWVNEMHRIQGFYWGYLTNAFIVFGRHEGMPYYTVHFWSLSVEEHFYLVWPLIVYFLGRRKSIGVCLAVICLSPFLRYYNIHSVVAWAAHLGLRTPPAEIVNYLFTPFRLDSLAIGSMLALASREIRDYQVLIRPARYLLPISFCGIASMALANKGILIWSDPIVQVVGFTLLAFLFGSVIVLSTMTAKPTWLTRLFNLSVLRFFGKYSYSMYIFHETVNVLVLKLLFKDEVRITLWGSHYLGVLAHFTLSAIFTVLIALVTWNLIEKHFLKMKILFSSKSAAD